EAGNNFLLMLTEKGQSKEISTEMRTHRLNHMYPGDLSKLDGVVKANFPGQYARALEREKVELEKALVESEVCIKAEDRVKASIPLEEKLSTHALNGNALSDAQTGQLRGFSRLYSDHYQSVDRLPYYPPRRREE